ncbi:MAG: hypothetical protein AB2787_03675 [Candidatus Thiodiazotropha endolucinida]
MPDLPTGAVIRNSAEIQFELFEPLITPEVINIIDTTKPNYMVDTLPLITITDEIMINWTGEDVIREIDTYTTFVSENGGIFHPLISETSNTSKSFTGVSGNTYGFSVSQRILQET